MVGDGVAPANSSYWGCWRMKIVQSHVLDASVVVCMEAIIVGVVTRGMASNACWGYVAVACDLRTSVTATESVMLVIQPWQASFTVTTKTQNQSQLCGNKACVR